MIEAVFIKDGSGFSGFKVTGHSNFSDVGADVVCAGVSSAVQMATNMITEVLKIKAEVDFTDDYVYVNTKNCVYDNNLQNVYKGLYLHISLLEEDYKKNIKVSIMEV